MIGDARSPTSAAGVEASVAYAPVPRLLNVDVAGAILVGELSRSCDEAKMSRALNVAFQGEEEEEEEEGGRSCRENAAGRSVFDSLSIASTAAI